MRANKVTILSLVVATALCANETTTLEQINVVEKSNSKLVKDISSEELKSADLAEALTKNSANISIVRRNGIANDIILRGQKKDNINILIDDAKIHGACPNRMDPPTSHVVSSNISNVKIIEGPFDVENFGTLSGVVKVETKDPKEGFNGELNLNAGSFGYKKASTTISGGNEKVKALISASTEESKAYKDGNGDNFLEQQKKRGVIPAGTPPSDSKYKDGDIKAFDKKSVLTKLQFNVTDDQDLKLSYTANRSDGILYPAGPMDADYDDSDIYTLGYTLRDLGTFSKQLDLDYYYSKVDHPMSGKLRIGGLMPTHMTNHLKSSIWGTKVKNSLEVADSLVTFGLDTSVRNWRGGMYSTNTNTGVITVKEYDRRMYSTDTTNKAFFTKVEKSIGAFDLETGIRYDNTDIDTQRPNVADKKYSSLNAYVFGAYNIDEQSKVFAGFGKSSRVPDARELYQLGQTAPSPDTEALAISKASSNPNLEDTKNYEFDLGFEKTIGNFYIKPKVFYSVLKDYIYNSEVTSTSTKFENIDAKIYGLDVSGSYFFTDTFSFDYGVAYQRGKKDGDFDDKDLAEIPPLKANLGLNYQYQKSKFKAEVVAVDRWNKFDDSAKEQEIAGYAVTNLKYAQELFKHFELTLGVDNVFDKVYNSTNTYQDIRYVEVGGDPILFNDPGRYGYVNLKYSF